MNVETKVSLIRKNFAAVEEKHNAFFLEGVPRWPGEKQDYLRNHHQSIDNYSLHRFDFEKLGCYNLPEVIVEDLKAAFEAAKNGDVFAL